MSALLPAAIRLFLFPTGTATPDRRRHLAYLGLSTLLLSAHQRGRVRRGGAEGRCGCQALPTFLSTLCGSPSCLGVPAPAAGLVLIVVSRRIDPFHFDMKGKTTHWFTGIPIDGLAAVNSPSSAATRPNGPDGD